MGLSRENGSGKGGVGRGMGLGREVGGWGVGGVSARAKGFNSVQLRLIRELTYVLFVPCTACFLND